MIFNLSGGLPTNFKVVGNPQPENPKENTIWLNTDVKITGEYFQAEQPEEMQSGEVWINIGTKSPVAFNALKKGTVMVYPISVKQMQEDGTLVFLTAKSWQNGQWVDWDRRPIYIEELNATGWARYSEGVAGEYVRCYDRGFTRNSTEPAIWCWATKAGGIVYYGYALLAASEAALAETSLAGGVITVVKTVTTPKGNTLYVRYLASGYTAEYTPTLDITSNEKTYQLDISYADTHSYDAAAGTLSPELLEYAEKILFD